MPRMAGVSWRMRSRPTLVRPRPRTVARWSSGWPLRPRTSFTRSAISGSLLGTDLLQLLAAQARHLLRAAQPAQAVQRRLHHVVRVPRALRLGEDVADPHRLEHRAHRAARDDPGSLAGRLEQHAPGAEVAHHLVRDGVARERNLEEVLLRLLAALADGLGDLVRLPQPGADVALAVPHHHQRAEAEPPAALDHLGDAVDVDHPVVQLGQVVRIDRCRHSVSLELQARFAGPFGDRCDAAVVVESVPVEHHRGDLRRLAFFRHQLADLLGQLALLALPILQLGRERRRGRERLAARVVDHLGVDVVQAAVDGEARPLGAARHLEPDARLAPLAQVALLLDGGFAHGLRRPRLALLAADGFLRVLDALALVGLGRPHLADLCGGEAHQVLVGPLHRDPDLLALQLRLVPDAGDVQRPLEALGDALDHVGDQRAGEAVQLTRAARVVRPVDLHLPVLDRHLHLAVELLRDLALGPLDLHQAGLRVDLHLLGDLDGKPSDAGHVALLPDRGEQLAPEVLLARLAVDHHAPGRGQHRDAQPVHHRRDVAVRDVAAQARLGLPADLADRRALVRVVLEDHGQDALLAVLLGRDLADEALVARSRPRRTASRAS